MSSDPVANLSSQTTVDSDSARVVASQDAPTATTTWPAPRSAASATRSGTRPAHRFLDDVARSAIHWPAGLPGPPTVAAGLTMITGPAGLHRVAHPLRSRPGCHFPTRSPIRHYVTVT